MKKILVPTDFSDTADKARDYAIQLAQVLDAEIILLNTYHIPYSGDGAVTFINMDQFAKQESEKLMKEEMEYCQLNYSDVKFTSVCELGLVVDTIKSMSKKHAADLIVMGTTGASGFVGNLLGSNTAALIGSIATPIIAVPGNTTFNFPKRIVVANDLKESGEEMLYGTLKNIAGGTGSSIDFLFIVDEDAAVDKKKKRLQAANFDEEFDSSYHPFHFKEDEDVEEGILDYIDEKEFDLLVVVAHQRGFWEKLFHKSVSKALVKEAKLPILVLSD